MRAIPLLLLVACSASEAPPAPPAPVTRPAPRPRVRPVTRHDVHERADVLRAKLAGQGFTVLVEGAFVVIGDEPPDAVQARAEGIVRWTIDRLRRDYFEVEPPLPLEIWLFRDAKSYEEHALTFFGEEPSTPFGYYSPSHRALVMNIATGGGTLVHEMVHPYVEANFPEAPAWFNEGLASLYEQSTDADGHIMGLPNWRLPGLQAAIRRHELPSFDALVGTTSDEFYAMPHGYAQARYLCYWLQTQGQLTHFYRRFREDRRSDPSGRTTLTEVIGRDLGEFQRDWETWVLALRFGG